MYVLAPPLHPLSIQNISGPNDARVCVKVSKHRAQGVVMAQVVTHFPLNVVRNNRRRSDVSSFVGRCFEMEGSRRDRRGWRLGKSEECRRAACTEE
jgi:hypothetical protein